ncbi:TetR/AcrR family transcriptional regulator [Azospirillum canadense]|uniref:TetR/AcrR family transcriptional regulator n=1 Tax=Azospirillum canadense TaxID=403962 RepID=UPI00222743F5|nr:TetR family transcriptional regulator C-terminal domain-containing protein [Azospirillum canadense]MCW2241175.1 AcrR family transcriptional regulator [Azospirillum canadense]
MAKKFGAETDDTQKLAQPPRRSFSKKAPDVRRQELIDATFRCLVRFGEAETSVRTIADEAGLSLGMVRHHFRSKDELLAETYRHLSAQLQEQTARALAESGPSPGEQLHALVMAGLRPPILDRDYIRVRFLFWGLTHTNEAVRRVHEEIYGRFQQQLHDLIDQTARANGATVDAAAVTLAVMALLKGAWLEWSLAPDAVDPQALVAQILPVLRQSLS